ncbi:hypothetical protein PIB30_094568, partial [Stylosanthes scabra]|nr:hypothetical protein [Stylosanthes scabra]
VALDIEYHHNMLISHQKVYPKEVIVGWYPTDLGVPDDSALIQEFYSKEATMIEVEQDEYKYMNGEAFIFFRPCVIRCP